ncbi:sterol desaturase family protein [candidate division KSB1 bacterium]|nr:sterol desaturase family protein [candidate division KSB1 bacterium]
MDTFLIFFEQMPVWQKLVCVLGCLTFCWLLEGNYPLFQFDYQKWKHGGANLTFFLGVGIINLIFGIATVGVFEWVQQNEIGILFIIGLPIWAELLITLLLLELVAQYFVHYLMHRIKWMWRLHMVHHSDTKVDATTGTRHHPGDYILRELFALVAIILIGAPIAFYLTYRIFSIFFTYTTHANITMPNWLDKSLSWIFITPNMHKFHHHFEIPWTDTNFGNIFSIWDRIFGTMVYDDPKKVRYGLDFLDGTPDENILFLLKMPFDKNISRD